MHSFPFQSLTVEQVDLYENIMTPVLSEVSFFFLIRIWWHKKNFYVENSVHCH